MATAPTAPGLPAEATVAGLPAAVRRTLKDPLTLFLLAGGAIFALYGLATRGEPVVYTADIEAALVAEHAALTGRQATEADRARLKTEHIADELLFREAIARGEHLTDSVVRKRLVDKMRFAASGGQREPTEAELVNHYAENIAAYRSEPRTSFTQVYFAQKPEGATALLMELQQGRRIAGDDFWVGREFPRYGASMVRGIFGQPFVEALAAAPVGQWTGPVRSPRGWHFVRKSAVEAPSVIPFAEIRDVVRRDMMMAATETALAGEIARLAEIHGVEDAR